MLLQYPSEPPENSAVAAQLRQTGLAPATKSVTTAIWRVKRPDMGGAMTRRKASLFAGLLVAAVAAATVLAAPAAPSGQAVTATKLAAVMTVNQEIPAPKGARGAGTFTGTVSGNTITFRMTFKGLTGEAAAAHIHVALAGKANPAPAVTLCGPCTSGQSGKVTVSASVLKKIVGGGTYVNVHTPKNGAGEIRGQVASS